MRCLQVVLAASIIALLAAAPAVARPPGGDWTFVRKDSYVHYACKQDGKKGGLQVKTATWFNGKGEMIREFPADAALAKGGNRNVVSKSTKRWIEGFAFMKFRGVGAGNRLWMQADGYGPPDVWGDGIRVARLTDCAR